MFKELLWPFIVERDAHMSATGHTDAAFGASFKCLDLILQLPLRAFCSPRMYWGVGGERQCMAQGESSSQIGTGAFKINNNNNYYYNNKSVKSVAFHSEPCWEDIGRRCFHSSCHTVFLCKKNVKLLYNLFLIWVCCSHLFQPSREL